MRDVKVLQETRNKLKEQVKKICKRLEELRSDGRKFNEYTIDERVEIKQLDELRKLYQFQMVGIEFALNEDCKILRSTWSIDYMTGAENYKLKTE